MKSEAQQTRLDEPSTDGLTAKQFDALHDIVSKMRAENHVCKMNQAGYPGLAPGDRDRLNNASQGVETARNEAADSFERWTAKRALTQTIDDRIASLTQRMVTLTALKQRVNDMREHECALAIDIMSMTRDQIL